MSDANKKLTWEHRGGATDPYEAPAQLEVNLDLLRARWAPNYSNFLGATPLTQESIIAGIRAASHVLSKGSPPYSIVSPKTYAHLESNLDTDCGCPLCYFHLGHKANAEVERELRVWWDSISVVDEDE